MTHFRDRIPWEWIMLYAFTLGFFVSISLTIFRLQLIVDPVQLYHLHLVLLAVLISRAALDYIIGRRIYFPNSYTVAKA